MFQFVPFAFCQGTGHHQKEPNSILSALPLQGFIHIDEIPLSLYSWLNRPSSLSISSYERWVMSPFLIFVILHWTLPSMFMSLLYCGPRTGLRTPGVISLVLSRGERIAFLHLLTSFCPRQPRIPLVLFATRTHSRLVFNVVSTKLTFSAELLSRWVPPVGAGLYTSSHWTPWDSCQPSCPGRSGCLHNSLIWQPLP